MVVYLKCILHITGEVYQTLPLYSNLKTTGVYIYATDYDIKGHKARIHAESEVKMIAMRHFSFLIRQLYLTVMVKK